MDDTTANIFRYLPTTPKDRTWGCYVTAAGTHDVPPGRSSFADPSGHQLWKKRRVLKDYGIIYLTRGRGVFRSRDTGEITLNAGDMLVLFPNAWHRFRPDPDTGWKEYWLLFNGLQPDRLFEHQVISPKSPVLSVGVGNQIEKLFLDVVDATQAQPSVPNRVLAALTGLILAHAVSAATERTEGDAGPEQDVAKAQCYLEERVHEDVDMAQLAALVEMSCSTFNRHFRRATGLTPHQYHIQLRMSRAKELLEDPDLRIKQIASRLGFHDQYYFSRVFRKHAGCSTLEWRKTMGRGLS